MNIERSILVAFLGNYLINTVAAALVALLPVSTSTGVLTAQYISFVALAVIVVALLSWWYMRAGNKSLNGGVAFGVVGFVVAIATAFITGIAGVLSQTGSFSAVVGVLPNFWPFLYNWSTLVLFCYWVFPAALVGWYFGHGRAPAPMM